MRQRNIQRIKNVSHLMDEFTKCLLVLKSVPKPSYDERVKYLNAYNTLLTMGCNDTLIERLSGVSREQAIRIINGIAP